MGCSFFFVTPATTAARPSFNPGCTTSKAVPTVDVVLGLLEAVRTFIAIVRPDSAYAGSILSRQSDIAFGAGFMALYFTSAAYGTNAVTKCKDMQPDDDARSWRPSRRSAAPAVDLTPVPLPPPLPSPAAPPTATAGPARETPGEGSPPDGGAAPAVPPPVEQHADPE